MWDCECGCQQIAHGLEFCPVCRKERDMGKATKSGASNRFDPQPEPEPEVKPKARKPKAETVELPADDPAED